MNIKTITCPRITDNCFSNIFRSNPLSLYEIKGKRYYIINKYNKHFDSY